MQRAKQPDGGVCVAASGSKGGRCQVSRCTTDTPRRPAPDAATRKLEKPLVPTHEGARMHSQCTRWRHLIWTKSAAPAGASTGDGLAKFGVAASVVGGRQ